MIIRADLRTTENLGDHGRESMVALPCDPLMTIGEFMQDVVANHGRWLSAAQPNALPKHDFVTLRIEAIHE